ncbi:hypothetical protein DRP77_05325, partial [Candidatus Poribacteria bacterium]
MELEERTARLEGIMEQINQRLSHLELEMGELRNWMKSELDGIREEIAELRKESVAAFRWTIGIMLSVLIPMWVTIILTILFKG